MTTPATAARRDRRGTRARYIEAYERISGLKFDDWIGAIRVKPPIAKRIEHRREHHGDVFIDPYEWLRDKSSQEVIDYLEAENAYTEQPLPLTWSLCGRRSSTRSRPGPRRPICRCPPGVATGGTTGAASRASSTGCNAVVRSAIPTTGHRRSSTRTPRFPASRSCWMRMSRPKGTTSSRSVPPPSASTDTSWRTRWTSKATSDTRCGSRTYVPESATTTRSPGSVRARRGPPTTTPSTT